MSVKYYLVCHKHKEKIWTCSDGFSGPRNQLTGNRTLAAFIITHRECDIRIIDEYNEECEEYKEWSELEWEEMLNYEK